MRNSRTFLILYLLLFSFSSFSQSAVCAYKYRKRITFNPAQVSGSSDLANFTALINIAADNDLRTVGNMGHVENANGFDIIFVADDGVTRLDHQLEMYTAASGELVAWVRIPLLSTSLNTNIYMYYGNTAISTNQSVDGTWDSSYKGVWHLNNNVFTDGTSNNNDATNGGSTNMTAAKIAGGRTFPGTNTNFVQLPLIGMSSGSGNGSVSMWGRITTYEASTYFFGVTSTQIGAGYANRVQIYTNDASGTLYLGLGGNHVTQANVHTLALNAWNHIALTWATTGVGVGNYSIYVNGVQRGTGAYTTFSVMHTFADIGNDGNASQRTEEITGNMDEVHVTNTTLSGDWIITEYNNQNTPSTFYTVSAEPKVWDGSNSTNYATAANWLNNTIPASGNDVIIDNGTNQPILQSNQQVNSLFIRTGATLAMSNLNLSVRSDITNCGTLSGGTGVLALNSAVANVQTQNLSGSGTFNLNDLTVNNTFAASPAVALNRSVAVSGDLILTSGIVYTSTTDILALGTGATSTGGSASSFVSGPMSKDGNSSFIFPVGKGTRWRRIRISNISGGSSSFRAEYMNTAFTSTAPVTAPLTDVSKLEYWELDRLTGAANANVSLYWEAANTSGINDCPDLTIARWSGTAWDERAATTAVGSSCAGTGTGTITTTAALSAFSPFTFGSKLIGVNPLPIELLSFEAVCQGREVVLNWSTASEKNNDHFIVERSPEGSTWIDLGHIRTSGTGSVPKSYSFSDPEAITDIAYYRLSQVDQDGKKEAFDIKSVQCISREERISIYPNPASNELTIQLDLVKDYGTGTIRLIDNLGRSCMEQSVDLLKGSHAYTLPLSISPGAYNVLFFSEHLILPVQKLVVK